MKILWLAFFAISSISGCMVEEREKFGCGKPGLVLNSGSNWVFAIDTLAGFPFATKYPIAIQMQVFDTYMDEVATSETSIDSAKLAAMPRFEDSLRLLKVGWTGMDKDGNPVKSGCYKARVNVRTLLPALGEADLPKDVATKVVMEWTFHFLRDKTDEE